MGSDIHAYIDYDGALTPDGELSVESFAANGGLGRNYQLFALMTGVRQYKNRMDRKDTLFTPRGIPDNVSPAVERDKRIADLWLACYTEEEIRNELSVGGSIIEQALSEIKSPENDTWQKRGIFSPAPSSMLTFANIFAGWLAECPQYSGARNAPLYTRRDRR